MMIKRPTVVAVSFGILLSAGGIFCLALAADVAYPLLKTFIQAAGLSGIGLGALLLYYREKILKEVFLLLGTFFFFFIVAEILLRCFDPFPNMPSWEQNHTEYGNLVQFDPLLGWSGIPNDSGVFVSENSRTLLHHNADGFRDVAHKVPNTDPAIVFLGDSFTWGYEVSWEDMFVNRLRKRLRGYELFNLSMRGYGTDQEIIAFKRWGPQGPLQFVVVMFSENDFSDNAQFIKYGKFKPQFVLQDGQLALTHVPVPRVDLWRTEGKAVSRQPSFRERIKAVILTSQLLHELYFRFTHLKNSPSPEPVLRTAGAEAYENQITESLLRALNEEVRKRGARLAVVAIPAKGQFAGKSDLPPYQERLEKICGSLPDVDYIDLAPYFKRTPFRTFYRLGIHLNRHGNQIVARALSDYFERHGVTS